MTERRDLVVQDVVSYHFPMLPGESRRQAMRRFNDIDARDQFIQKIHARESWVIDTETGHEVSEREEVTP